MTRRERLERKLEKREQWAQGREESADRHLAASSKAAEPFYMGQPILVGHHSEKRARAAQERVHRNGFAAVADMKMADHHRSKAAGLADQLEESIFSDDPDAVERLEEKIAALEKRQAFMVAANKICRNKKMNDEAKISELRKLSSALSDAAISEMIHPANSWQSVGFDGFMLTNNNANIRRCKERLAIVKARQARQARASEAEGGVIIDRIYGGVTARITFAEKPERNVIQALKDAGFRWSSTCWVGDADKVPAEVTAMIENAAPDQDDEQR